MGWRDRAALEEGVSQSWSGGCGERRTIDGGRRRRRDARGALGGAERRAEAAVAAFGPSPEQMRAEATEAERLARERGTPAKSVKVIGVLARRCN
eukprot:3947846-Prymnesium_polylepis.1